MKQMTTEQMKISVNRIMERWDPERDLGDPAVTYTDVQLVLIIETLINRVDDLELELKTILNLPSFPDY